MDYKELYRSKLVTAEEAVLSLKSGDSTIYGQLGVCPNKFFETMPILKGHASHVKAFLPMSLVEYDIFTDPSLNDTYDRACTFLLGATRKGYMNGAVDFYPSDLHIGPRRWIEENGDDVFVVAVTPMDEHGFFYMPLCLIHEYDSFKAAKRVIVEVNPGLPHVYGDTMIHISEVDMIIEADTPIQGLPESQPSELDKTIGQYVATLVNDGDTIQLGWGSIPDAVALFLTDKHDLGIHSEMLCNSMADLVEAGVVTGKKKSFMPGYIVGTFASGTKKLYDMIDNNPSIRLFRGSYVNDPQIVSANDNFDAINSCVSVDLTGQVASESIGSAQYSGSGGQFDMSYGAIHSKGGKNIFAVHSTKKKGTVSTITAQLAAGSVVTTSRNTADYVVTEYGIAPLRGRTVRQRVDNLIAIAHPDFRAELRKQAEELGLH